MSDMGTIIKLIRLLRCKISEDYAISLKDYPANLSRIDIINDAYSKASEIFNAESEYSIATKTLLLYINHLNEILDIYTKDIDNLSASLKLFCAYIKIHSLINEGIVTLKKKLSTELSNNKHYYALFSLDYYLELSRTDGTAKALSELEEDVNLRAYTYYTQAYKEYLDILPGFIYLLDTLRPDTK